MAADLVSNSGSKIKSLEEEGIKNLVWSLIFSGMSMSLHGSSRPASGAEHMFSHALDKMGRFGLHGEQVGIGTIFFSNLQGNGWEKIKDTLQQLGAPTAAKEIGISEKSFVDAMLVSKDVRKRYTILDRKPLTRDVVFKVARETGIF
jgi:glycerol-1-phosphate dehydrogenase [NAD(P)+]